MSDDIVDQLRDLANWYAPMPRKANTSKTLDDAANWIELYRDVIWHLWAHGHGCGRQDCPLCTEAYRAFTEDNERMFKDE